MVVHLGVGQGAVAEKMPHVFVRLVEAWVCRGDRPHNDGSNGIYDCRAAEGYARCVWV
jgi:hypothetical protein